ncbi:MAG: peptidoglycan-binding protein [Hyphomicrobiales bacterium]|nr:peptidoglycan-binding protein [Hyphomicrobiales bacterium]
MKSGPLNLRNSDFDLREAARAAARRAGMTLGEWLDDAIAERAARLRIRPDELDESGQIEAIAARLGALPLEDASPRPLQKRPDAEPPLRGRQPNMRLLDAAAARLGLRQDAMPHASAGKEDARDVARRIAELEEALGRRTGGRTFDIGRPPVENRLRRIAESLLEADPDFHAPDMGPIAALRSQIADLSRAVLVIGERAAKHSLEPALLDLLSRIEASREVGVSDAALAPVMHTLLDIRGALENSPAATARALGKDIESLHRRLDMLTKSDDGAGIGALRIQVETLARNLAELAMRLSGHFALQGQIALLAERVEEIAAAPRELSEQLAVAVDDLRKDIERLDASPAFLTLERQIEDIAVQQMHETSSVSQTLSALRESIDNLAEHPTMRAMRMQLQHLTQITGDLPTRLLGKFDELRRAIEHMAANPALSAELRNATLPGHVAESLAEMRLSLERLAASAGVRLAEDQAQRLQGIEDRIAEISDKLDAPPIIERIASLQEALLARMDRVRNDMPNAQVAALQTRVEDVHRAVSQTSSVRLEDLVAQLASKLERADIGAHDPRALQAIENQVLRIAERLDRHGETSEAIGSLERSIGELFARIGEARQVADPAINETIARDLSSLRSLQDETDRRTRATLDAVHETLEKVVDRLAMIETEFGVLRLPAAKADAPAIAVQPVDASASFAPSRHDMAIELSEPRAAQQSFIAAARRATQLMGGAPSPPPRIDHDDAIASRIEMSGEKTAAGETSRKMILGVAGLGVAGLVLTLGAYRAMRDDGSLFGALTPQILTPQAQILGPQAATELPDAAAATASGLTQQTATDMFDPTPVATIARPVPGLDILRDLAESGRAPAQYELASRLIEGRGVARDAAEAMRWLEKAAAQNYAPAQYRLGALYEKGAGAERSLKTALQWYTKAAQAGHVRAMHNLGVLLADGVNDRPDYIAAAALFRRAAQHGLRDSQYNIAVLYTRGLGVELNLVEAYKYFSLAAAEGDLESFNRRDEIGAQLLPKQMEEARNAVDTFAVREADANANEPAAFEAIVAARANAPPAPALTPGRKVENRVTSLK